ncbi:MAG TPA: glycerophosphodiester phosphodiesterase family protein [Allosphingosinicella sp.]
MAVRKRIVWLGAGLVVASGIYLNNASWAAHPTEGLTILSHRGVHQTYRREGLTNETCTASRIDPPTHAFLENTLPSMKAAFALGADVVELDVHPTADGNFAVFHDWTVDCRTEGHGVTRGKSMAELKRLDVGYGYTADGGRTFPFRGKGAGLMPSLDEVLRAFPNRRFLINFKSNDPREGEAMAAWLAARPWARVERLSFYGGERPAERLRTLRPDLKTMSRGSLKGCAKAYLLLGWTGYVPAACRHSVVFVPINYRWAAWGWPNRLLARMEAAGSDVYAIAPVDRHDPGLGGIDTPEQVARLGPAFRGGVSTDRIDVVGPLLKRRP